MMDPATTRRPGRSWRLRTPGSLGAGARPSPTLCNRTREGASSTPTHKSAHWRALTSMMAEPGRMFSGSRASFYPRMATPPWSSLQIEHRPAAVLGRRGSDPAVAAQEAGAEVAPPKLPCPPFCLVRSGMQPRRGDGPEGAVRVYAPEPLSKTTTWSYWTMFLHRASGMIPQTPNPNPPPPIRELFMFPQLRFGNDM